MARLIGGNPPEFKYKYIIGTSLNLFSTFEGQIEIKCSPAVKNSLASDYSPNFSYPKTLKGSGGLAYPILDQSKIMSDDANCNIISFTFIAEKSSKGINIDPSC